MNPKHQNPNAKKPNRRAIAPYNFVPLPEKVIPAELPLPDQDKYHPDHYTGYIQCDLTTKSPTYVRAATNLEFYRRWWSDEARQMRKMLANSKARVEYANFFHLDNAQQPVIPGSTLRGMIRALVEIVGYGKMQWVTDEKLVFRAVGDTTSLGIYYKGRLLREDNEKEYTPLIQAGYIEKDENNHQWFIRPAQTIGGTTFARIHHDDIPINLPSWHRCKNASRIWVKLGDYDYQEVRGGFIHLKYTPVLEAYNKPVGDWQEAVLARSGRMNKKNREAVMFPPDKDVTPIKIKSELLQKYREQISKEQQKLLGENGVLQPHQPVFYLMEQGELVLFGHPMMFRLTYDKSPLDFVPSSLRNEATIDLSEAIFGYVKSKEIPEGKDRTYAGRVFFSDANFKSAANGIWLSEKPITPQILASPKPTTFQHYLTQQKPNDKKELNHYASAPSDDTVIRGHKLYWHKGAVGKKNIQEKEDVDWRDDTQHTQIKAVKAEVGFSFRICFQNLSQVELGALLWALMLPGEDDHDYCHKVGMGKPLGMGAVKLTATLHSAQQKTKTRYTRLLDDKGQWYQPQNSQMNPEACIQAFEKYVLEHMDETERNRAQSLKDVPRIQILLKMLEWPGPIPIEENTRYMEIERDRNKHYIGTPKKGKVNEYAHRPVLPDPLDVVFPGLSFKNQSSSQKKSESVTPSDPTEVMIKGLIKAIEAIPSDKVAGQIRDYYDQWQNLEANEALKRQLAIAICKRVESSAFRKNANKRKRWYQELKASLPELAS